jgi:hypothetical protein
MLLSSLESGSSSCRFDFGQDSSAAEARPESNEVVVYKGLWLFSKNVGATPLVEYA